MKIVKKKKTYPTKAIILLLPLLTAALISACDDGAAQPPLDIIVSAPSSRGETADENPGRPDVETNQNESIGEAPRGAEQIKENPPGGVKPSGRPPDTPEQAEAPQPPAEQTHPPEQPADAQPAEDSTYGAFPFAFTANDLYGNTVTEETLGEKKLFFIHYWATWCGPCINEMPDLAWVAAEYADEVGFIALLDDYSSNIDGAVRIAEATGVPASNTRS